MLFPWSRREGDADGCQQEGAGAQDDAYGLHDHAQRQQLLRADAATEHVEDIAAGQAGETQHPRKGCRQDRIGAASDHKRATPHFGTRDDYRETLFILQSLLKTIEVA
jgi:hypothetical protein